MKQTRTCVNYTPVNCPVCKVDCLDALKMKVEDHSGGCTDFGRIKFQCSEGCGAKPVLIIHNHKGQLMLGWEVNGELLPLTPVS